MHSHNGQPPDETAPPQERQPLPYVDRTGAQIALGDKILFLPSAQMPMILELIGDEVVLDPSVPPGTRRLLFMMQMGIYAQPGSQVPGFLVAVPQAPTAPAPAPSPIIFPSGRH